MSQCSTFISCFLSDIHAHAHMSMNMVIQHITIQKWILISKNSSNQSIKNSKDIYNVTNGFYFKYMLFFLALIK